MNRLGWTALHEAIILGKGTATYDDTVRVLVAGRADIRLPLKQDGVAPLEHARSKGYARQVATLEKALRQDAAGPVDQAEANRRLLAAATDGDPDAAALALRAGADLETTGDRRRTPLLAATNDRTDVARVLVALGRTRTPSTTSTTRPGWSPASPAASRCSRRCCRRTRT